MNQLTKREQERIRGAQYRAKHRDRLNALQRIKHRKPEFRLRQCWNNIVGRCNDPRHTSFPWYGARGIKNFLTFEDLKVLWDRDGASQMKKPSIERKKSSEDYTFDNCEFVEFVDNLKRKTGMKYRRRGAQNEIASPNS